MLKEFKLQDPGEGIHEVEIREVLVKIGDRVEDGDPAFVVESDKAAIELTSPWPGTVAEIAVGEGDTVKVGGVLMRVDSEGGAAAAEAEAESEPEVEAESEPEVESAPAPTPAPASSPATAAPAVSRDGTIKAAPTARKLAKARGIDLAQVRPSGCKGHVTRADVERFGAAPAASTSAPERFERMAMPDFSVYGPVRHVPLKSVRKAIALHLERAWREIPHAMLQDSIDMTGLERFRRRHAANVAAQGGRLTRTVFVVKAALIALRKHPRFNASLDMSKGEIVEKDYIHVGIAVDSKYGLVVPVIRNADKLSLFDLSIAIRDVAERARDGKVGPEDLKGGTFTVTNVGILGGTGFFPIINHPEVAILGCGRGKIEPAIVGDLDHYHVEARYIVPFSMGFDHRVNDGADAARFFNSFRKILMDPEKFVLHG